MTQWRRRFLRVNKILSMLGLARRAGKLSGGYDASVEKIRNAEALLLIAAADISEKTYKNLEFEAKKQGIPCVRIDDSMAELSKACAIRTGIVAVLDSGFSKAIRSLIESGQTEKKEETPNDD